MRIIKQAGQRAQQADNRPTMHKSKAEWRLMSGTGAAIDYGLNRDDGDIKVRITGERPAGRRD